MADVTLPQLGETVTEGTITRWFKKVGDSIAADEALFEVSTDKVDTEVPSPVAGVVLEIRAAEESKRPSPSLSGMSERSDTTHMRVREPSAPSSRAPVGPTGVSARSTISPSAKFATMARLMPTPSLPATAP